MFRITKCDKAILLKSVSVITKCDRLFLRKASVIAKCGRLYYKVSQVLQSVAFITK